MRRRILIAGPVLEFNYIDASPCFIGGLFEVIARIGQGRIRIS